MIKEYYLANVKHRMTFRKLINKDIKKKPGLQLQVGF